MGIGRKQLTLAGLLLCLSQWALAVPIVYDDRAHFIADSGAVGIGAIPRANGTINIGGFILSGSLNASRNWSTLISEASDLAINGVENFNFSSPGPLYAFGFDFHEPNVPAPTSPDTCNASCIDSTFDITLLLAGLSVGGFSFNRPDASLEFVGVISAQAFDTVWVRERIGGIDNEFFGNFLVGREPVSVPEPGTLALLSAGLFGLYRANRRRYKS